MHHSFVAELAAPGCKVPVRACDIESSPVWLWPSIGEYPVYDEVAYEAMIKDKRRMSAYSDAVRRYAPGRTVVDIGTGQDAVWALAAARAGARHVWAVEVIPKSARIARKNIEQAGFADRITVVEGLSTEIELPEPVDVCVSEIIGTLAGSEGAGSVLRDARKRLVKPDGVFIPHRSATTAVALDLDSAYLGEHPGFPTLVLRYVEEVFASVGRPFDLRVAVEGVQDNPAVRERSYLSGAVEVEPLEFNGDLDPEGTDGAELTFTRAGNVSGLALGMRLWVAEDDEPIDSLTQSSSWAPVYAPLAEEGLSVRPGDRFVFDFTTTLSDDGVHPDYALTGELHRTDGPAVPLSWGSTHHGDGFRATPFYRSLFPGPGAP
ncbi:50S ribosomal protein L11 methyltransferase [Streptomyces rugosispiralis]|uniref:50S ribosomal protein L11 methyltransferase n=1 Tax=Streptomyces rugosispiralis TaxID=2967341 RepID=A0ABT1VC55_9ACTN|nr:50S ribosomal protein L11 methyltransferase [Streptomyces rugosispiralis]MCQ8194981.1 50S ribosomal protein L11 methyltransferase [Streptomyces rugosispiralis]